MIEIIPDPECGGEAIYAKKENEVAIAIQNRADPNIITRVYTIYGTTETLQASRDQWRCPILLHIPFTQPKSAFRICFMIAGYRLAIILQYRE